MKSVWKFLVPMCGGILRLPRGAVILTATCKHDSIFMWAEVDTEADYESREIGVVGTGSEVFGGKYVASVDDDPFVWHLYDYGSCAAK